MDENNRKVIKVSRKIKDVAILILITTLFYLFIYLVIWPSFSQFVEVVIPVLFVLTLLYLIIRIIKSISAKTDEQRKGGRSKIVYSILCLFFILFLWGTHFFFKDIYPSPQNGALYEDDIPCVPNQALGIACDEYRDFSNSLGAPGSRAPSMGFENDRNSYDGSYNKGYGNPSISDTREFLKTSYASEIKTRDVSDTVKDVKNSVKGADGRIDSLESSEKYGYISFVVPKSKFEAFRDEIESLTHEKLYTEDISSKNLLTQKQGIEEQETDVNYRLTNIQIEKERITNPFTDIRNRINNVTKAKRK
jgi:Ca2+/Na+ antiporter